LATKTTTSEATMNMDRTTTDQRLTGIARVLPLAGIGFAGLTIAGDLVIGPFPDGASPTSVLSASYRAHHSQVALGGVLYGWAAAFFALSPPLSTCGCVRPHRCSPDCCSSGRPSTPVRRH
jgi:hypothetical protein